MNVPGMWAFVVMTVTLVAARYCEVYAVILASWKAEHVIERTPVSMGQFSVVRVM